MDPELSIKKHIEAGGRVDWKELPGLVKQACNDFLHEYGSDNAEGGLLFDDDPEKKFRKMDWGNGKATYRLKGNLTKREPNGDLTYISPIEFIIQTDGETITNIEKKLG